MGNRIKFAGMFLACGAWLAAAPAIAQNVANGKSLYEENCASCHGFPPQGGAERAGNNPVLISGAINGKVASMSFLRSFLGSQDTADIAAYIGSLSAPLPPPVIVPAFDYTDLWWAGASESGWGVSLSQHPSNKLFMVIYAYDIDRRPLWLVVSDGTWSSPTLYSGPLYRVTALPPTGAWDNARRTVTQVGTATVAFTDRDHANFKYSVNGVQVSKTISRPAF